MITETEETGAGLRSMTTEANWAWSWEKIENVLILLSEAEARIKTGAEATPVLREALETVGEIVRISHSEPDREVGLIRAIITLAPAAGEAGSTMLCERALEIAQEMKCIGCRNTSLEDTPKRIIKMTPDPEARIRIIDRLSLRMEKFFREDAERQCHEIRKEAEARCAESKRLAKSMLKITPPLPFIGKRLIRKVAGRECHEIRKDAEARCAEATGWISECRSHLKKDWAVQSESVKLRDVDLGDLFRVVNESRLRRNEGQFQRPDFAKKPTPQPAEGPKMKIGDKI